MIGTLTAADSTFRNTTGSAVVVIPGASGIVDATFSNCNFTGNTGAGLAAEPNTRITAFNSVASNNGGRGFVAEGAGSAVMNLTNCIASHNGTGVAATGGALVRIANTQITNNSAFGIDGNSGGTVSSYGNNYITGNGGGVAGNQPNGVPVAQQ